MSFSGPCIKHLLTEIQRPIEAWRVIVGKLCIWNDFANAVYHACNLLNMRLFRFDPDEVRAILKRGDAIQYAAIFASAGAELEQIGRQALWTQQLSVAVQNDIAILGRGGVNFFTIKEAIVQVAQVASSG